MPGATSIAYVCETRRGLLIMEANDRLPFFRALRALRTAGTVAELRQIDARFGLGLWEAWDDLQPIDPSDEDIERYDQSSDDDEPVQHWRDHPATADFMFELDTDDMPRPYDEWLPEGAAETLADWSVDDYLVGPKHASEARDLLISLGVRLVDEPALADAFDLS